MKHSCYIFIGPSGSGKTSLAAAVFSPEQKVISHTTRLPRFGEENGRDYFFISTAEFKALIAAAEFAEFDNYNGNFYGVSLKAIEEKILLDDCYDVLTLAGFINLEKRYGSSIIPVRLNISKSETAARMQARGETSETIAMRLPLFEAEVLANQALNKYENLIEIDANQSLSKMIAEFQQKRKNHS